MLVRDGRFEGDLRGLVTDESASGESLGRRETIGGHAAGDVDDGA